MVSKAMAGGTSLCTKGVFVVKKGLLKSIACMMAFIMVSVSAAIPSGDVKAASETTQQEVVYQEYFDAAKVKEYFVNKVAPAYVTDEEIQDNYGYLFGGWFTNHTIDGVTKLKPIKTVEELEAIATAGTGYFAKFVPSYVLSVKCLNKYGTHKDIDKTNMRFVSALDSTNYARFGFKIDGVVVENDGNLNKVGASQTIMLEGETKVFYRKWAIYSNETTKKNYTPDMVLGSEAKYYMTSQLLNISNKNFFRIYSIQPFWETYNGVVVYGLTKYAHVEDGIYGYINVPINLKNSNSVAAGIVEFDWTELYQKGYLFKGAECGKQFKMQRTKAKVESGKQLVRCTVLADPTGGLQDKVSDDIYMNLRFEPKDNTVEPKPFNGEFYHFGVNGEEFSNVAETKFVEKEYDVWDIQY